MRQFCAYFNTCMANLDGMESWLDRHGDRLSDNDKKAITLQMESENILLPKGEDVQERWDSIRVFMSGTKVSNFGLS